MVTYDALADLQREDPRLRIHAISTATNVNVGEIRDLTSLLLERCPQMDHHNLALIRGDRKDASLITPDLAEYEALYTFIREQWSPREKGRYGALVEPMLQWAKVETLKQGTQVIPCRAGVLTAVVTARGDVSVCELHEPLGNLREQSFTEIWASKRAEDIRASIAAKACHCTTEVFLWPSIVYQPLPLLKSMRETYAWSKEQERRAAAADPAR
jgi:MoaA/NifB/PqqE/SkfB family radical SAM enzyme